MDELQEIRNEIRKAQLDFIKEIEKREKELVNGGNCFKGIEKPKVNFFDLLSQYVKPDIV